MVSRSSGSKVEVSLPSIVARATYRIGTGVDDCRRPVYSAAEHVDGSVGLSRYVFDVRAQDTTENIFHAMDTMRDLAPAAYHRVCRVSHDVVATSVSRHLQDDLVTEHKTEDRSRAQSLIMTMDGDEPGECLNR